jgi:hypothetical protein
MELNLSGNQFEEMACVYIGNALSIIIYIIVDPSLPYERPSL